MIESPAFECGDTTARHPSQLPAISQQAGAMCLRSHAGVREVLLISGLNSDRLGIPKGHIEPGEISWTTAEREAFEEAGILGAAQKLPIGRYFYRKSIGEEGYQMNVHRLHVHRSLSEYPEKLQRSVQWISSEAAVQAASRVGLQRLLRNI
jgi:8-oxo-dGTP pyrophosphatase MutT (NUDIX family)